MKKMFLTAIIFCLCLAVNAETLNDARYLPNRDNYKEFTQANYPILYKYLKDYSRELYYRFDPKIFPHPNYGLGEAFYIHRDGTITYNCYNPKYLFKKNMLFRELLSKYPPPPFPEGIEDDRIPVGFDIIVTKPADWNRLSAGIYQLAAFKEQPALSIYADKSIKFKNMTEKKCTKLGYQWDTKGYCITPCIFEGDLK